MARIARRALRMRGLPLFATESPWELTADSDGRAGLRLFEPRYVEMARRVLPPVGDGRFGYAEAYPPRRGTSGMLVEAVDFSWAEEAVPPSQRQGPVLVTLQARRRFRLLADPQQDEVAPGQAPLYVAHVQLLEDRDVVRMMSSPQASPLDEKVLEAMGAPAVKAGTRLIAKEDAPVFESEDSWNQMYRIPRGVLVVAAGPPSLVEGYVMVPIVPSGAVELALFREMLPSGEVNMPSEQELKAAILNMGAEPSPAPARGARVPGLGRKSHGRGRV